jgi:transposase
MPRFPARSCGGPSRRSSGGIRTERRGALFQPSSVPGGWRLRPSSAGRSSVSGAASGSGSGACGWARHRGSGQDQHPGAPEGGWCRPKGGSAKERDSREALGRSCGGYGTKACVMADGAGRVIAFRLARGQAHELPHATPLLDRLTGVPKRAVADRGCTSHAFRQHIWDMGARPAVPPQRYEAPVACPDGIYNNRNQVERLGARLKTCRASPPATRKQPPASSSASSAWLPHSTGSNTKRD